MIVEDRAQADVRILLVEDDADDAYVVRRVLERRTEPVHFESTSNGLEAKELLDNRRNQDDLLPEIIIIDINMPLMNGLELLDWIRSDDIFSNIIPVIYTTSTEPEILADARRRGANGALSKQWDNRDHGALLQLFVDLWLHSSAVHLAPMDDSEWT